MLSEEEIRKLKINVFNQCDDETTRLVAEMLKHTEQLESDKQKLIEKLEEEIKEEREIMKPLEHKSMAFHYANGRETLAQDILKILKGEKQ